MPSGYSPEGGYGNSGSSGYSIVTPPTKKPNPTPIMTSASKNRTVNVKDFGAKGDGVNDDTLACQNAIDSLKYGGVVYFPAGNYLFKRRFSGLDPHNNYAVYINTSNIIIQGDGIGSSIIKAADEYTTLFLTSDISISNILFRDITVQGDTSQAFPLESKFSSFTGATSALIKVGGVLNNDVTDVVFERVQFLDIKTVGLFLANVKRFFCSNCEFLYYSNGFPPLNCNGFGPRVGIFSGASPVYDLVIENCIFNGNLNGKDINDDGADGFVWFSNGGNILVSNCVIRNYKLEGMQFETGPTIVSNNSFYTQIGNSSSGAIFISDQQSDISKTESPIHKINNNSVFGGSYAFNCAPQIDVVKASRKTLVTIANNIISLEDKLNATDVISLGSCGNALITNNLIRGAHRFINNTTYFLSDYITISNNEVFGIKDTCILLNCPVTKMVKITNNTLSKGNYHIFATKPDENQKYSILIRDNICLNVNEEIENLVLQDTLGGNGTISYL